MGRVSFEGWSVLKPCGVCGRFKGHNRDCSVAKEEKEGIRGLIIFGGLMLATPLFILFLKWLGLGVFK